MTADDLGLPRTVVLIGLMGAGKSCIGKKLASRLGASFVDVDEEIEKAAGCSIADFFAKHGEKDFREGERRVISRLMAGEPMIVASGGGSFMNEETRALIAQRGISLWLRADLDVLSKRTEGRTHRPLLRVADPKSVLKRLMDERYPVYGLADVVVDTKDQPADMTVDVVQSALLEHVRDRYGSGDRNDGR